MPENSAGLQVVARTAEPIGTDGQARDPDNASEQKRGLDRPLN